MRTKTEGDMRGDESRVIWLLLSREGFHVFKDSNHMFVCNRTDQLFYAACESPPHIPLSAAASHRQHKIFSFIYFYVDEISSEEWEKSDRNSLSLRGRCVLLVLFSRIFRVKRRKASDFLCNKFRTLEWFIRVEVKVDFRATTWNFLNSFRNVYKRI